MITQRMEEEAKLTIQELEQGKLPAEQKGNLITNVNAAKASCNGMTAEEKIQAVAENQFYSSCILARLYNRVSKGTEGALYDRVTDTVFRSATSTPLVAGPETPA